MTLTVKIYSPNDKWAENMVTNLNVITGSRMTASLGNLRELTKYGIDKLPATLFFKNDILVTKMIGKFQNGEIERKLEELAWAPQRLTRR
jgi:hypothetical protein